MGLSIWLLMTSSLLEIFIDGGMLITVHVVSMQMCNVSGLSCPNMTGFEKMHHRACGVIDANCKKYIIFAG